MQNYLQSKRRRKVFVIVAVTIFMLLTTFTVCLIVSSNNVDGTINNHVNAARFASYLDTFPENENAKDTAPLKKDIKMNNETLKNAKKTVLPSIPERNVRVLFKNSGVHEIPLEEYVMGCVLGEMPLSFGPQALMAQSVAIRTFTVRMMSGYGKHKNADVCTDYNCCQNYIAPDSLEIGEKNLDKLKDAVLATRGVIMVYDSQPIEAVYHSSSGECTLDSEDVWGGRVEYLRSVPSPEGEQAIAAGGFGHRVGLSQHGANILATNGKSYIEILKYYYSGISFSFV